MSPHHRAALIVPTFDDWSSLSVVLDDISSQQGELGPIEVFVVNDGSITSPGPDFGHAHGLAALWILDLAANVGHQRAIAIGLAHVSTFDRFDVIALMDSDGEDQAADLPRLIGRHRGKPDHVTVAARASRSENLRFRVFYRLYRWMYSILTGHRLDFGNFCVLSPSAVSRLVFMPELWNNVPGAIMRSRLIVERIPVDRGPRIDGQSKMNFSALVAHGLGAMSVFVDTIFVRLLTITAVAFAAVTLVVAAALGLRLTTEVPLPGWFALTATVAVSGLITIMALLTLTTFTLIATRSSRAFIPKVDSAVFIRTIRSIT